MKTYKWEMFKIPNTLCNMISKNHKEMKEVKVRLVYLYPKKDFKINVIAPRTYQMMFSDHNYDMGIQS